MSAYYVEMQGIHADLLEFSGYILAAEDSEFQLFVRDGQEYILPRSGPRFLPIEGNEADLRRSRRRIVPIPAR
jgi:hypothetical protein